MVLEIYLTIEFLAHFPANILIPRAAFDVLHLDLWAYTSWALLIGAYTSNAMTKPTLTMTTRYRCTRVTTARGRWTTR